MDKKEEKIVMSDLLDQYNSQVESDDIHYEHYDWTYNDGSGCCC